MDNASKALIMAGAILIAVALVGVGVYLYSTATEQVASGSQELDAAKVRTLNSKLEMYEGEINGAKVKSLIKNVNTYNKKGTFPGNPTSNPSNVTIEVVTAESGAPSASFSVVQKTVAGENTTSAIEYTYSGIVDSSKFFVSFDYLGDSGTISDVNIQAVK